MEVHPPTGAWWGGWWERLIQSVKRILRKILGKAALTYEELLTVLCECESIVNGRPLTYLSEDVEDLIPLTPAMFLREIRGDGVADLDVLDGEGLNRRWKYRQRLRDDLRSRFRQEYLATLVQPGKGKKVGGAIKPGDIVLIGNDNAKRLDWVMARVLEVFPGRDGVVRVARLKTATGEVTRPVQRLYPLEVSLEERPHILMPDVGKEPEVKTRSGRVIRKPDRLGV